MLTTRNPNISASTGCPKKPLLSKIVTLILKKHFFGTPGISLNSNIVPKLPFVSLSSMSSKHRKVLISQYSFLLWSKYFELYYLLFLNSIDTTLSYRCNFFSKYHHISYLLAFRDILCYVVLNYY